MQSVTARLPLQFRVLYRQFLLRVIDLESLSIEADIPRFLGQFAGILILFSLIKALGTLLFGIPPALALSVEQGQIENTLLIAGLIIVASWDAAFPDRRDAMVLGPLPVRARTILMAKLVASAALIGVGLLALNFASSMPYALVFGSNGSLRFLAAEWIALASGCVVLHGAVLTVQGAMALMLPRRIFLMASAVLQLAAFALFLSVYFLEPTLMAWPELALPQNYWVAWSPVMWLAAMLNQLNGTLPASLGWLAGRGWMALGAAAAGALGSLALCYLRTMKKTVEAPDLVPGAGGLHCTPRVGSSLTTAIFWFSLRSLARSKQHRVVFALYMSVVFAVTLSWVRSLIGGHGRGPVSLDFLMPTFMIMAFCVFGLRNVFSLPISLNANWVLRVTQLRPTEKYFGATRLCLLLLGVLPAWLLSALMSVELRPWSDAALHLGVLALVGWLFVEVALVRFEKVPFTCSYMPGKTNIQVLFWGFLFVFLIMMLTGAQYELTALHDGGRYAIVVGVLVTSAGALWVRNRTRAKSAVLYFEELLPEVLTSLHLSDGMRPQEFNSGSRDA
jgi:hypothetical protein